MTTVDTMNTNTVNTNMRSARIVGVLFLAATVTYMLGAGLIDSILAASDSLLQVYPNRTQVISGVLLQFVDAAAVVGIGVLLFPILKKHNEAVALGYAGTRILECAFLVVGGISTLSLIPLSQEAILAGATDASQLHTLGNLMVAGSDMAYLVAMGTLGLGSLMFCSLLYIARLVPRPISVLGLVGYAALLVDSVLKIFGFDLGLILYLPGGLFELILPLWLIFKGFNVTIVTFRDVKSDSNELETMSLSKV